MTLRHLGSIRCKKRAWMRDRPWYEVFVSKNMDSTPVYRRESIGLRKFAAFVSEGKSLEDEANGPNLNTRLVTQQKMRSK